MASTKTAELTADSILYGIRLFSNQAEHVTLAAFPYDILLPPGVEVDIPWLQDSDIQSVVIQAPGTTQDIVETPMAETEKEGWLRLAASAFRFWDNDLDEIWNAV